MSVLQQDEECGCIDPGAFGWTLAGIPMIVARVVPRLDVGRKAISRVGGKKDLIGE